MGIIDRYLLRQFLKTFVICFMSLMGLYVVIDCTTHIEKFIQCGEKCGGVLPLIGRYYGYQTLAFFDRTSSFLTLVSAMFTVAWIQRHNEMTALMAAGLSRIRVIMPIIVVAVVICIIAAINREMVIPNFQEQLSRKTQDLIGDHGQEIESRYDSETFVILRGAASYSNKKRIESPTFDLPASLARYGDQLTADNAYYHPPEGKNRPGGYLFDNVKTPKHLETRPSLYLKGTPILITPRDRPDWLKPNQCFLVSNFGFEQLTGNVKLNSVWQLIAGLRNPSLAYRETERVAIHSRLVQPLYDLVLLFLGLPLVARRETRHIFLAIGTCMAITTVFTLTIIGSQQLGTSGLVTPAQAAWIPLMIFMPAAVGLSQALWE